jgi:uncharacterized membrane protein YwaF
MYYGSPFYIASLAMLPILAGLIYAVLCRRGKKTQYAVVLILMILNTAQHFLKPLIYPQYWGTGFSSIVSAYNMCAVLIISSPFVLLWGGKFFKNFVFFVGSVAGIAAVALPFWYIGMDVSELGWGYARFYICHALLFITSLQPLLLGLHRPRWHEFWQVGLGFFLALGIILINDVIFIRLGLYPGTDAADLYGSLLKMNPCGVMAPPAGLPWLEGIVRIFTPDIFWGIPFLWYAIALYLGVSLIALVLFLLADRTGLRIRRHKKARR